MAENTVSIYHSFKHLELISVQVTILTKTLKRLQQTRALEGLFSVCLILSFRGRQSTAPMVFHALRQRRFPHREGRRLKE